MSLGLETTPTPGAEHRQIQSALKKKVVRFAYSLPDVFDPAEGALEVLQNNIND